MWPPKQIEIAISQKKGFRRVLEHVDVGIIFILGS